MGRSQQTFNKKEREKNKRKKKKDKVERREQRKLEKAEKGKLTFEDQITYLDEDGNPTSTPPDPSKKKKIKAEDIIIGVPPRDNTEEEPIRTGTVDTFTDKGFGFIVDAANQTRIFVHISDAYHSIQPGDRVSFEIEMGPKGAKAYNVHQSNPTD